MVYFGQPSFTHEEAHNQNHLTRMNKFFSVGLAFFSFLVVAQAKPAISSDGGGAFPGLRDAVVLIIRHAEKPDTGNGLSAMGGQRAQAYVNYFRNLTEGGQSLTPVALFATADSEASHRPRLTLEPLSHALGLKIDSRFKNKKLPELAEELRSHPHGKCILIAWHHGEIPELLHALGADPEKLLPGGKWPGQVFGWMLELHYDHEGHLLPDRTRRINEHLLPDDAGQ